MTTAGSFESLYDEYFAFVWRGVRRMGVAPANVDDAIQDVFVVVHRRLADFEGRSSVKTWLTGIMLRVASDHRRRERPKDRNQPLEDEIPDSRSGPDELASRHQAVALLDRLLKELDEDKRAVFVLAELEQFTAPEISEALGVKLNTVYSRLRLAREAFEKALARHRAGNR